MYSDQQTHQIKTKQLELHQLQREQEDLDEEGFTTQTGEG